MNVGGYTILICKADGDVCVLVILVCEIFLSIPYYFPLLIFSKKAALYVSEIGMI